MIDSLTSDNSHDFLQRYNETYGWLLKDNKEIFVYINGVSRDRVSFENGKGLSYFANVDSDVKFKFIPVKNGWFNATNKRTYLLTRKPSRQWKRGIAHSNTSIFDINRMSFDVSWEILSSIFSDSFKELNYSKTFLGRSCAMSQHFAISDNNHLYFYQKIIGLYVDKNKEFVLENSLVKQELQDLITRNSWDLKVTCHEN